MRSLTKTVADLSISSSSSLLLLLLVALLLLLPLPTSAFLHHHPNKHIHIHHPTTPYDSSILYEQQQEQQEHPRAELRNKANYDELRMMNDVNVIVVKESTQQAFQGKTVLLTGASGGLGKELALHLARCQVSQLVLSGRNQEALDSVAQACQDLHPSLLTHVLPCDLADKTSVQQLGEQALKVCAEHNNNNNGDNKDKKAIIDVLINNGGVSSRGNFVDTSLQVDEQVMQINFFSGAALAKAVVPSMVEHQSGGRIIWISSIQGLIGIPSRTSYGASKFAVEGYCQSLRAELASSGVSVHVISPGYIKTNLSRSALKGDGTAHGKMDETTAKGQPPQEVAIALLDAVAKGRSELVVAATWTARIALWLRFLAPTQLQKLLVKQFEKSKSKVD